MAEGVTDTIGDYDFLDNYYELAPQGHTQFIPDWNGMVWPNTPDEVYTPRRATGRCSWTR